MHTQAYAHVRKQRETGTDTHTHTYTDTDTHTHTYTDTYLYPRRHIHIYAHINTKTDTAYKHDSPTNMMFKKSKTCICWYLYRLWDMKYEAFASKKPSSIGPGLQNIN